MRQGITNVILGTALIIAVTVLLQRTSDPVRAQQGSSDPFEELAAQPGESSQPQPLTEPGNLSSVFSDEPAPLRAAGTEPGFVAEDPRFYGPASSPFGDPLQDAASVDELFPFDSPADRAVFVAEPEPAPLANGYSLRSSCPDTPQEPVNEKAQLQSEYVTLATRRAQLMTIEELRAGIQVATSDTNEIAARRQLEDARAILTRLLEEHPDSEAARKAREMLESELDQAGTSIAPGEPETATIPVPVLDGDDLANEPPRE